MRDLAGWSGALAIVAAAASSAFGHGGQVAPPDAHLDPGPPLGPPYRPPTLNPDPALTPGANDPKVAVTRWETWWSANKDAFLRLAERLAGDAPGATLGAAPLSERGQKAARQRADALRRRLAGLFVDALSDKEFEVRTAAAIGVGKT